MSLYLVVLLTMDFLIFATHPFGNATDGNGNVKPINPQITTTLKASGALITGECCVFRMYHLIPII